MQIKLKNSVTQDSTPSASDLPEVGELAVNGNINSIGGFMRASDNSIVKIFGPGSVTTPTATTTVSGISELATNTETTTGSATNRVVTPAGLNAVTVAERSTSNSTYLALAGGTLTGVVAATAGSNSAPSIHFGDSDSGIFGGTNTVSLAAGGTTRLTADTGVSVVGTLAVTGAITSTSDLTIPDKIIHSGDPNTAIRFPAADTVSVETSGSERLRADSLGHFIVGSSTARTNFFNSSSNHSPRLQVEAANTNTGRAAIGLIHGASSTLGPYLALGKHRGSVGGNTIVQSADEIGKITFQGNDGTQFVESASIVGFVDGTPGADDMPGRLVFSTTADGAASPTTRLTIDSAGTSTFTGNIVTTGTLGSGNLTITSAAPQIIFTDSDTNPDYTVFAANGNFNIYDATNAATRFLINNDGHIDIAGNLDVGAGIDVTGAITGTGDLTIDTNTLHVDSSNNRVGVGTTSPDFPLETVFTNNNSSSFSTSLAMGSGANADLYALHLQNLGTGNSESGLLFSAGNTQFGQWSVNCLKTGAFVGDLAFRTRTGSATSAERMRITSAGKVGIGTTSPSQKLQVTSGNILLDGTDQYIYLSNDSDQWISANAASNYLRIGTANSERLRIASSGNVGIGTTSPSCPLEIKSGSGGDGTITLLELNANANDLNDAVKLNFARADSDIGSIVLEKVNNNNTTDFIFNTRESNSVSESMRLEGSGRLLLGHSISQTIGGNGHPLVQLNVNSNQQVLSLARFENVPAGPSINLGKSRASSAGNYTVVQSGDNLGSINFHGADGTDLIPSGASIEAQVDGTPGSNDMPGRLLFNTTADGSGGPTERMRIDSSGNVGIGTSSPTGFIHIEGSSNGTETYGRFSTGSANGDQNLYIQSSSSRDHMALQVKTGAGANDDLSLNPSGGNVGIGTTSPAKALEVVNNTVPQFQVGMANDADRASLMHNGSDLYLDTTAGGLIFRGASNAERLRITSNGELLKGATTARAQFFHSVVAPGVQIEGNGDFDRQLSITSSSSTSNFGAVLILGRQRSGTIGGNTIVQAGDSVGLLSFQANDGTNFIEGARISTNIESGVGGNDMPAYLSFFTNPGNTSLSERMRIRSDGRIGIGTTSPNTILSVNYTNTGSNGLRLQDDTNNTVTTLETTATSYNYAGVSGHHSLLYASRNLAIVADGANQGAIKFMAGNGERMRILHDGGVCINATSRPVVGTEFLGVQGGSASNTVGIAAAVSNNNGIPFFASNSSNTSDQRLMRFAAGSAGNTRGTIIFNGSAMVYGGSSDYRLKENITSISDGITKLKSLNPINFNWIKDETNTSIMGFIAHEVQAVMPEAVAGEKDAVDSEGKEDYQEMDYGRITPLIVTALQEAITKIETLETKVAALEAA